MSLLFQLSCFSLLLAQFALPRRLAFLPLLIAACHLGNVPVIEFGGGFSICRLLIVAGLLRAAAERRFIWSFRQALDVLVAVWACCALVSTFAHNPGGSNALSMRVSLVYEIAGTYLYGRAYIRNQTDLLRFCKCLAAVMIPLALLMLVEQVTGRSPYAAVGAAYQEAWVRQNGRVRAAGPFGNAILGGTAGAVALPLILPLLWTRYRRLAIAGVAACGLIVLCSASSGPIMTLFSGLAAMALWRWRKSIGRIRTCVIVGLILLQFLMKSPVWYLMARIDLVGGSTSWYRAELITQALNHLNEWWLFGTDYTRHWMPYGIEWSKNQVDITNYYLRMGVFGGIPLMLSFIAILFKAFQLLGRKMSTLRIARDPAELMLWSLGAALFAHCITFLSVSYFDQSYVLFCLLIGILPGICSVPIARNIKAASPVRYRGEPFVLRQADRSGTGPLASPRGPADWSAKLKAPENRSGFE